MTYAQLTCLKTVYKRIHSKEYCLVKQSFCELETKEAEVAKMDSIPTVVETANTLKVESSISKAHQLPLADPFAFNLFFFQLPDLLFYDTPQPFLLHF